MSAEEKADCEHNTQIMSRKVEMERKNTVSVGDIKEYAFLKSEKKEEEVKTVKPVQKEVKPHFDTKYDWYQNSTHIFVSFKVIGDKELAKNIKVDFEEQSVSLTAPDEVDQ